MDTFEIELAMEAKKRLDSYGIKYKNKDTAHELLVKLYTFLEKYITPTKRLVYISSELEQKKAELPISVQESLLKLTEWMQDGVDVNGFQSRGLYGNGSRDYQNMLYGIVHLHLSASKSDTKPIIKKNRFAKPGKYLLYAYVTQQSAYFIDVEEHLENSSEEAVGWTKKQILEIIKSNWPELIEKCRIYGIVPCDETGNEVDLGDKEISDLITNHVNPPISLNGDVYIPNMGVTANGCSMNAVLQANATIRYARRIQRNYGEIIDEFGKRLKRE